MVRMTREKQKENCLHKSSTKSLKAFRVIRRLRFRGISGHLVIWFSKISIFNLFSFPRVLKFIWKCSSKLSKQVPFYSAWWIEGSWEIWNPLVSKYDICLIIEKDFFVYGLQIARNGNITGILVNFCMRRSCKVSYIELQLPQIFIAQKLWKLHSEWKVGSTPLPQIIERYCSPVIWFLSKGSLEVNRLT